MDKIIKPWALIRQLQNLGDVGNVGAAEKGL